ncbi:GNAT family N-acetyltransferase [Arsukibacterium perlucidum]|uniref:GNAT family N-acetyltransferase n=1 Tax=Arsukibacterium perlucidum TaxID=368811 RepID=UPI0003818169|nr:GNAT family N-acetyltransferase [Arsukibacterium perlucidum]
MNIVIRKLTETDLPAFSMLWQFYQYHQSAFDDEDIDSSGRFDIEEEYLSDVVAGDEDCDAYLIIVEGNIAGFVTVEPTEILQREMPELSDIFILPKYRSKGIALHAVCQLMLNNSLNWHVAVYEKDLEALTFWDRLFAKLPIENVLKIEPAETEGFYEFVITNK